MTRPRTMLAWIKDSPSIAAKAFRFAIVGFFSSAVFALIAALAVSGFAIPPNPASIIAYVGSMPLSFIGNRIFAFRSTDTYQSDALRFMVLHAVGISVAYGSMLFAAGFLGMHYLLGVLFAVVLVPAFNFLVANFWVFAHQQTE